MKKISLTFAREAMEQIVDWADKEDGVLLSKNGDEPVAVVLTIDHYRGMLALFDLASDPDWLMDRYETIQQAQKGNFPEYSKLELPLS